MSDRILAWSIILAFLSLCVRSEWPDHAWDRVSQVAGLAFAAGMIGLFVAALLMAHVIPLLHRIEREGLSPVLWDGAKEFAWLVAACVGLVALMLAAWAASIYLHWSAAVFGVPLLYGAALGFLFRWIDRHRRPLSSNHLGRRRSLAASPLPCKRV